MIGKLSQQSDQCTAHKIDGESAEGKLDTLAELLGVAAHKVAQDRSDEPARADEK